MSARVLLAEGDYNLQQTVTRILSGEGIEAVCAGDGRDALCILNEIGPDLLIAECALRGKSGYELCHYVRQEPDFHSLPVILLDNNFDAFNQSMAYSVGADAYLSKPFGASDLTGIVHRLLNGRGKPISEELTFTNQAEMDQRMPLSENYGSEVSDVEPASIPVLTTRPASAVEAIKAGLPQAIRPQAAPAQGRKRNYAVLALLGGAVLAALLGYALLQRPPASVSPIAQHQLSADQMAKSDILGVEGEQNEKPSSKQEQDDARVGEMASPQGDGATGTLIKDEDAEAVEASPTINSMGLMGGANRPITPTESSQNSSNALAKDTPDAGDDHIDSQPTRPRSVRSLKQNTISSHFRRSGREMKEAGKHIGSGAKHFGQGSGKASVYAGKKVGRGVKRIGSAFKKVF